MKKILISFLIVLLDLSISMVFADQYQGSPVPVNPIVMGQGGSFSANANGYNSLFFNPAGFAVGKGDVTLLSANMWAFLDDTILTIAADPSAYFTNMETQFSDFFSNSAEIETFVEANPEVIVEVFEELYPDFPTPLDPDNPTIEEIAAIQLYMKTFDPETIEPEDMAGVAMTIMEAVSESDESAISIPSGNMRIGSNIGFGIVKNGFGFGVSVNADAILEGSNLMKATGALEATLMGTAGYAFNLGELITVGASIRPMYRIYTSVSASEILESVMMTEDGDPMEYFMGIPAYYGFGLGVDFGAILNLGPLHAGLTLTDAYTKFSYNEAPMSELLASFESGQVPAENVPDAIFRVPTDISAGVSFHPDWGAFKYLIDPEVHLTLKNVVSELITLKEGDTFNFVKSLHFGANVKLLSFVNLRAGYNGGYLSGGLGIRLLFIELNVAGFMNASGAEDFSGGFSQGGLSAEVALRF